MDGAQVRLVPRVQAVCKLAWAKTRRIIFSIAFLPRELVSAIGSPERRNRDGDSTRKFNIGVFTQPGSKTELSGFARHVRFTLGSRHRQPAPACPVGAANNGHGGQRRAARRSSASSALTRRG